MKQKILLMLLALVSLIPIRIFAYIPDDYDFEKDGFYYQITKEATTSSPVGECKIVGLYSYEVTQLTVPESAINYNGWLNGSYPTYNVTAIASGSIEIESNSYLNLFIIGPNIKTIEAGAFCGSTYNLRRVVVPKSLSGQMAASGVGNFYGLKYYDDSADLAFSGDFLVRNENNKPVEIILYIGSGTSATIPSTVKNIAPGAFEMAELTSLTIPEGVEYIGQNAFGFSRIQSLTLPSSIKRLDNAALGRTSAQSIDVSKVTIEFPDSLLIENYMTSTYKLPANLKKIPAYCFQFNQSLTEIDLPSTIEEIGEWAFQGSTVSSFTTPTDLRKIGDYAFN